MELTIAIILFILTYVLLLSLPKIRAYIALGSAAMFIVLGILPIKDVFTTIDWNVILMILGTMGIVSLFIESKMPALLADLIIEKTPNVKWAIVSLSLFAGIISAFVDNVATVLMIAPVALTIAKKLDISPVPSIIAIAIASNLQGAATLVGDTTSIILAGKLDMTFLDFFWYKGRLGMFWVVEIAAVVATFVLIYKFRHEKQRIEAMERTVVTDYFPTFILLGMIVLLIIVSFLKIPYVNHLKNGLICVTLYLIGLAYNAIRTKNFNFVGKSIKEIDYFTILLLLGLFLVIGGIEQAGLVREIGELFGKLGNNPFLIYTLIVWASVIFSAFIDNIPYVMTMIPVIETITAPLNEQYPGLKILLLFGLLTGATLGGNLTPIGASANITGIGILRRDGYDVKAWDFMKISIPYTLAAVITGYILIWFIWS